MQINQWMDQKLYIGFRISCFHHESVVKLDRSKWLPDSSLYPLKSVFSKALRRRSFIRSEDVGFRLSGKRIQPGVHVVLQVSHIMHRKI
ncbi:hypothetical protein Hanom_Chr15g01344231 [Helianthus anomalus]